MTTPTQPAPVVFCLDSQGNVGHSDSAKRGTIYGALPVADFDALTAKVAALEAERDTALARIKVMGALLGDARKCVVLVNVNGYYDNWLVRLDAALAEREG